MIIAVNYFQFEQLERRSLKQIRASTGFEPVTSALPVRCAGLFAILGRDFDQILRQTISVRRKALLKNTNLLASRHIKRGNTSSLTAKEIWV